MHSRLAWFLAVYDRMGWDSLDPPQMPYVAFGRSDG
jgi:hypothetical protein